MRDGDASPAYLRLMEMAEAEGDWRALGENARRQLAVNPLIPAPFRGLARASEELGASDEADRRVPCRFAFSTTPTPPECITIWPACFASPASRKRPGARCSSRSSKRPAFAKPTSFCSSLIENQTARLKAPERPARPR